MILAGITIGALTSNNGVLNRATGSKTETNKGEELEIVRISSMEMASKETIEDRNKLNHDEMETIVENNARGLSFELLDDEDGYIVNFTQRRRYYKIYDNGETEEVNVEPDKTPGDITKDKDGNDLDGETKPFEIWSIEDLVEFSENYTQYQTSNIILGRTLNFKSKLSYTDGKVLGCNSIEELMERLTNDENSGFKPICLFEGTFDGNNYEINNIYSHVKSGTSQANTGFFEENKGTIKNLTIKGKYKFEGSDTLIYMGGLVAKNYGRLENCSNYVEFNTTCENGCFAGITAYNKLGKIINCKNFANISLNKDSNNTYLGGIVGYAYDSSESDKTVIANCINEGNIDAENKNKGIIGGIIGESEGVLMFNCINKGNITLNKFKGTTAVFVGGMAGYSRSNLTVNCCNRGNLDVDTSTSPIDKRWSIGGIFGQGRGQEDYVLLNTGAIKVVGGGTTVEVGGIHGRCYWDSVENIYNIGKVTTNNVATDSEGTLSGKAWTNNTVTGGYTANLGPTKAAGNQSWLPNSTDLDANSLKDIFNNEISNEQKYVTTASGYGTDIEAARSNSITMES